MVPANSSRAKATFWDSVGVDEATVLALEDFDILCLRHFALLVVWAGGIARRIGRVAEKKAGHAKCE